MGIIEQIRKNVFLISIDEKRKTQDGKIKKFENLWYLPNGISYNSYLILDTEKNILIEAIDHPFIEEYIRLIETVISPDKIDIIIFNHLEPDHCGGILELLKKAKNAVIILSTKGEKIFRTLYTEIPSNKIVIVNDDEISTGEYTFKFISAPYLHWPETMFTYLKEENILFTCDAFGAYTSLNKKIYSTEHEWSLLEKEAKRYYSTIISPYAKFVQKALTNLKNEINSDMKIKLIAPSHGPLHNKTIDKIIELYDNWSIGKTIEKVVIIFGSMYGHTAKYVDELVSELKIRDINVEALDVSYIDVSEILSKLLDAGVIVFATPTYDAYMFPPLEYILMLINHKRFASRPVGLIGKCSWSGGGLKKLRKQIEEDLKFPIIEPIIELRGEKPESELTNEIALLANNISEIIISKY